MITRKGIVKDTHRTLGGYLFANRNVVQSHPQCSGDITQLDQFRTNKQTAVSRLPKQKSQKYYFRPTERCMKYRIPTNLTQYTTRHTLASNNSLFSKYLAHPFPGGQPGGEQK